MIEKLRHGKENRMNGAGTNSLFLRFTNVYEFDDGFVRPRAVLFTILWKQG